MMVNLTEREQAVLAALLETLRPWVEGACSDEPLSGPDLVDDLVGWVAAMDVGPRLLDAIADKLNDGGPRSGPGED